MKKIILASSSPRRKEILENMGIDFEIIPSDYEEIWDNLDFSYEKVEQMALNKAESVFQKQNLKISAEFILAADTVVVLDNKILIKPKDENDAISMLKKLSGKKHSVVTSICAINVKSAYKKILSTTSYVEFENLSDKQIDDYVDKYKPLDKAGSYGIQELPEGFVKSVEGSFENIIGLCPQAVNKVLGNIN